MMRAIRFRRLSLGVIGAAALLSATASVAPQGSAMAAGRSDAGQCFSDTAGYRVATLGGGSLYIQSGDDVYRAEIRGACPGLPARGGVRRPFLIARARHFFCVGEVNDIYAPNRGNAVDRCPFTITAKLSKTEAASLAKHLQ